MRNLYISNILLSWLSTVRALLCYNAGGEGPWLRLCFPSADVTPCCFEGDECMSSGVCRGATNGIVGTIYSPGCTERTLDDEKCGGGGYCKGDFLFQCPDDKSKFCCTGQLPDICNCTSGKGTFTLGSLGTPVAIARGTQASVNGNARSSSSADNSNTGSTPTGSLGSSAPSSAIVASSTNGIPDTTADNPGEVSGTSLETNGPTASSGSPTKGKKSNQSLILGAGVGVPVAILTIAGIAAAGFLYRRQKRRDLQRHLNAGNDREPKVELPAGAPEAKKDDAVEVGGNARYELPAHTNAPRHEIDGGVLTERHELPDNVQRYAYELPGETRKT